MSIYLIDYENTKGAGLEGIEELTAEDTVYLFYSENANTLTFKMYDRISNAKARFQFIDVGVGTRNALDFQLTTWLGYLVCKGLGQKQYFYIVSQDKGFGSVCRFWKERSISVELVQDLSGRREEELKDQLQLQVMEVIKDQEVSRKIAAIILKYKTKQGINNALMREFPSQDNQRSKEYYKLIKPMLKDKKGK
jgi:hypothetical protein